MRTTNSDFGKYLKQLRQDRNLTQRAVSVELGYTGPQLISNIERGVCSVPDKLLGSFIRLYKVDEEEFISRATLAQENIIRSAVYSTLELEERKREANEK